MLNGGRCLLGSDDYYPEERPVRRAEVGPFWMDVFPVTNRQFAEFVAATRYVTFAEKAPDPKDYPGMLPEMMKAGSAVFVPTSGPVDLHDFSQWWRFIFGADWRHPLGPGSSIDDIMDHPVVQVAYEDAKAFAKWAGKELPSEAEWEFAAHGGLKEQPFAWGDTLAPNGRRMANYWQGEFPWKKASPDVGRTSAVGRFEPNGFGLHDMIGNVWEWTADWYSDQTVEAADRPCCGPPRQRAVRKMESFDPQSPLKKVPRKVAKGGSHLCAPNYCQRYRPAARHPQPVDSPTSHIGFRCIARI